MSTDAVEPGDVIEIGRRLRRLMAACDDVDLALGGSLYTVDPALDARAAPVRVAVAGCATLIHEFLGALEQTPAFVERRTKKLAKEAP